MNSRSSRILIRLLGIVMLAIIGFVAWVMIANRNPDLKQASVPVTDKAQQIEQGAYLAKVGNCMSCHTARGGLAWAGGRAIPTPFGDIYASNLTPDRKTGIGEWSSDDFWVAMQDGRRKDGSLLYPAFPYTSYTRMTRADSDALFAYLQTLPAIEQQNTPPALRSPYNNRELLVIWRALHFRPGQYKQDDTQSVEWNRGAYLVQGLGHCAACHSPRTTLGGIALKDELAGGMIPSLNWHAPALDSGKDSLGRWDAEQLVQFLREGRTKDRAVTGPMAEVVANSLQHLSDDDAHAMAIYLQSLPAHHRPSASGDALSKEARQAIVATGIRLYEKNCASCHQTNGKGVDHIYPALAGNPAVTAAIPSNTLRLVLHGGFAPSTAGNPRPFGMPPFAQLMTDEEIAAVVTYIRQAWGNQAAAVSTYDVNQYRSQEGL